MGIGSRLKHAWNAFTNADEQYRIRSDVVDIGGSYMFRPDRVRFRFSNERSIISSIYTRLSIDVAATDIRHVRLDENGRYLEDMDSGLNNCLTLEANLDQAGRQFRQDIAMTLFDSGVAAIVPVDTTLSPLETGGYDILTLRVGEVIQWYPKHVRLNLYNEAKGRREEITLEKKFVAIVENPLYSVMNESNSTLKRLIHKLNLLDIVDEQSSSGKLDLIIQLPYVIKSEARRSQAEQRRKDIEFQLKGSQYGIAYTDGTEKITQLNRPVENQLIKEVEMLTAMLYGQLGLTDAVMNGTADEKVMLNYFNRTIEPVVTAISEAMKRAFLTKTARSQRQSIMFFKDVFKLIPLADLAEIADKFTRNEILTSNEIRQIVGIKPSREAKADKLINSNMPVSDTGVSSGGEGQASADETASIMDEAFNSVNSSLDEVFTTLGVDENAVS
jgi:putative sterol carrier protein